MKLTLLTTPTILLLSLPLTLAQGPGNRPGLCYPESCGYALVNSGIMLGTKLRDSEDVTRNVYLRSTGVS
ncbi:hypothetical protein DDE83_007174 [Stemphylium lycopersici]|uniref:Uncharacterized protein n=1 Tax=Stemphylium lycopersici TaxID=183478 RepID=A0A364MWX8_STELY|nr:hypothetical protein DDE83_007174 [Stemphylium lycopersici]